MLDLASLPREDAPPNELQVRLLLAGPSQQSHAIALQACLSVLIKNARLVQAACMALKLMQQIRL